MAAASSSACGGQHPSNAAFSQPPTNHDFYRTLSRVRTMRSKRGDSGSARHTAWRSRPRRRALFVGVVVLVTSLVVLWHSRWVPCLTTTTPLRSDRHSVDYVFTSSGGLVPVYRTNGYAFSFRRWLDNTTRHSVDYATLVRPTQACRRGQPLIVVTSRPGNTRHRQAIRSTWAKDAGSMANASVTFVLGRTTTATTTAAAKAGAGAATVDSTIDIAYEIESWGDLLIFDFEDTYRNATVKTMLSFGYAAQCSPRYLLKVDDDTYVNVERLLASLRLLDATLAEPYIAGQVQAGESPHRWSTKWTVSRRQYPESLYPPFVSGCFYVVSGALLAGMAATARYTPPLDLEDVFMTGLVATKVSAIRVDLEGVWNRRRSTTPNCAYDNFVSGHYVGPGDMVRIHEARSFYAESCTRLLWMSWCSCVPRLRAVFA